LHVKTKRAAFGPVTAALILMLVTAFATAPRPVQGDDRGIDRLPGSWHSVVTTPNQGSFPGLITFNSDGGVTATESPGPFESPAHGNWERRGRDVAYTFFALFGTAAGAGHNAGSLKVVGTLHFDARNGGWTGPFRIQVFTPTGAVIFSDEGTIALTRIEIESL
jgi:hypothetical protein